VARRNTAAESVTQHVYRVDKDAKRDLLIHLIDAGQWFQVLVFTRTKHGANRLAEQLNRGGIESVAIHGNKSQNARTQALAGFKSGKVRVLVATDIAARGLDIDRLPHVVNYDIPNVPEDYIHRIGRTGRAGEEGAAVSLVGRDEVKLLNDIERLLRKNIPVLPAPAFEPKVLTPAAKRQPQAAAHARAEQIPRAGGAARHGQSRHRSGGHAVGDAAAAPRKRRPRNRSRQASGNAR
jgi:ATP-dependent RNA helicase RhlE